MNLVITFVIVAAQASGGQALAPGPVILRMAGEHKLILPPSISKAIQTSVPGFELWTLPAYGPDIAKYYEFTSRQAPWAVIGDFNADGLPDVIADGHSGKQCYRLCIWGGVAGPRVEVIQSRSCGGPSLNVLLYAPPGQQGTNFSDDRTFIYADGYMDYIWEKAGSTWYWDNGKWNEWVSSD